MHWTFSLLLLFVFVSSLLKEGWTAAFDGVLFVFLLFASVAAHEFGHAMMARRFGIRTPDILLLPIGGVARLDRIPEEPAREMAVALAGPAVTLAIIFALALVLFGLPVPALETDAGGWRPLAIQLVWANVVLLVFNMLPAFPMDGGRVLRALLSKRIGPRRATRIAASIGQSAAAIFGLLALYSGQPLLLLVSLFLFFAAGSEEKVGRLRRVGHEATISSRMIDRFYPLSSGATLEDAARLFEESAQDELALVDGAGHPAGFITLPPLLNAIRQHGSDAPARLAAVAPAEIVRDTCDAGKVSSLVIDKGGTVAIVDREGRLVGYQTLANLGEQAAIEEVIPINRSR